MDLTVNDLMCNMPMRDWPQALQDYVMFVGKHIGHSGGVFADCCQEYIDAGCPGSANELILAFVNRLLGITPEAHD